MAMSSIFVKSFQITALASALALAGCGGKNDTLPNTSVTPTNTGNTGNTGTGTDTGTNDAQVKDVNISKLTLDVATQGFIPSTGANATVKVTDKTGAGISGAIVSFASTGGLTFSTTNASVMTNAEGEATIFVKPANINDNGTYTLTATATHDDETATSKAYAFSLQKVSLNIESLTTSLNQGELLEIGGSTNISTKVKDANGLPQPNVTVDFTATCGSFENASVMTDSDGVAKTTYTAVKADGNLCDVTSATIMANITGATPKKAELSIKPIVGNAIAYTTNSEVKLGSNTSGTSATSTIEFTVFANGRPAADKEVEITKEFAPADFSFVELNNKTAKTVKTNAKGVAVVTVYPGSLPGPVELKATLKEDRSVFALSKNVSVARGRAYQDGMSIALSKNTLAERWDGDTAKVIVRLRDRVGNPVPDGTVVSFVSEGGNIGSNCATVNGACETVFETQNPRTEDGRITVLAYVEGDKAYIDTNGNNRFDAGVDTIPHNLGDFFRDDNENNTYDIGEYKYEKKAGSLACAASTFAIPNLANTCDNKLDTTLRRQFVLGLAQNVPTFTELNNTSLSDTIPAGSGIKEFKMYGNGTNTVSMPAGTTISLAAKDNTTSSPTVRIADKKIIVAKAKPKTSIVVQVGQNSYELTTDEKGWVEKPYAGPEKEATIISKEEDVTCTAEMTGGHIKVPDVVDLGIGKVADSDVTYTFKYKDCEAGDEIRITTNAPEPLPKTVIYSLAFK